MSDKESMIINGSSSTDFPTEADVLAKATNTADAMFNIDGIKAFSKKLSTVELISSAFDSADSLNATAIGAGVTAAGTSATIKILNAATSSHPLVAGIKLIALAFGGYKSAEAGIETQNYLKGKFQQDFRIKGTLPFLLQHDRIPLCQDKLEVYLPTFPTTSPSEAIARVMFSFVMKIKSIT